MRPFPVFFLVATVLLLMLIVPFVSAQEYIVQSGYDSPVTPDAESRVPVPVPFYALPLWVILAQLVLVPYELLLTIKFWAYLGIRRISSANVLDQEVRAQIYDHIKKNPGIHLRGLAGEMEMKMGTLRYHLNILRITHKIAVSEDVASVRFYENSGTYSLEEQHILKYLRNETTRKILSVLIDRPMVTRQEIADAVGVSGPSVSWHMKRLEDDNIITTRREGRVTAYEIPVPVARYISRQIQTPVRANG
ncbi:transcriptional regulator, ArsR family [Methanosphaerula palustris E1-9c]|uniref:Transcriptional regulator, ArsR family n=2 Tax=Methanosphaerula palustris TaxID=475088 RepID=B8GG48_METPE|nr:transcriptional regulator, ArsR family [Methanosphaerula palustris E1-9c]